MDLYNVRSYFVKIISIDIPIKNNKERLIGMAINKFILQQTEINLKLI